MCREKGINGGSECVWVCLSRARKLKLVVDVMSRGESSVRF